MEYAAESRQSELVEDLMNFFLSNDNKECFVATLYSCYDLLRPDTVMELAWKYKLTDYIMPYLIQVMKDYTNKVWEQNQKLHSFPFKIDRLEKAEEERRAEVKEKEQFESQSESGKQM